MGNRQRSGKSRDSGNEREPTRQEVPPRTQDQARNLYSLDERYSKAVDIAKKAEKAQERREWESALSQFEESNRILMEILEDIDNQTPCKTRPMAQDPDRYREWFQTESLRTMAINYESMMYCAKAGKVQDRVELCRKKMLEYFRKYDNVVHSQESKLDLIECFAHVTNSLLRKDLNGIADPPLFVDCTCSYLIALEDAYGLGWRISEKESARRQAMCDNLGRCLSRYPEVGNDMVDALLEASNRASEVGDRPGSFFLTSLFGKLYDQMLKQRCSWKGSRVSLEALYARSSSNLCNLLFSQGQNDSLLVSGNAMMGRYASFKEWESRANAAGVLVNCAAVLMQQDKTAEAVKVTEAVLACSMGPDGPICPPLQWQIRLGRYVALLLQTGQVAEAEKTAKRWMKARKETVRTGYLDGYRGIGISKEKYRFTYEEDTEIMFLHLALIASQRGRLKEVRQCLQQAKDFLQKHPKLNQARPDIAESIANMEEMYLCDNPADS